MKKVRWGIVGTAKIAREKVIPAMQNAPSCQVMAISSRSAVQAKEAAARLNIPKSYGSYQDLLDDPEIDAVYIPLPNNMHVEWTQKAIQSNKHVLCEKPLSLTVKEALELASSANQKPGLKVMEAFMYRFHPQWKYAKKLSDDKVIGEIRTIQSFFSYNNVDPQNIRNKKEAGGGGLMDIGCYCISLSRYLLDKEPIRVMGLAEFDPQMETDRLTSGILDFETASSTFTCSTQTFPYQRVNILGTTGRIEIMVPFNTPPDQQSEIFHYSASGPGRIVFNPVDQYTEQAEIFSRCILDDMPVPYDLNDAANNMKVIEALFESVHLNKWKTINK